MIVIRWMGITSKLTTLRPIKWLQRWRTSNDTPNQCFQNAQPSAEQSRPTVRPASSTSVPPSANNNSRPKGLVFVRIYNFAVAHRSVVSDRRVCLSDPPSVHGFVVIERYRVLHVATRSKRSQSPVLSLVTRPPNELVLLSLQPMTSDGRNSIKRQC